MATFTATFAFHNSFHYHVMIGTIDLDSDILRLLLLLAAYTPDLSNHDVLADIVANEHTATNGYARITFTGVAVSPSAEPFTLPIDLDFTTDPVFTAAGGSIVARRWGAFDDTPTTPVIDPMIATGLLNDADADVTTEDTNTLTFQLNANGLMRFQ